MREIVFYRSSAGRSPVEDYLATLSARQVRRIWDVLDAVRTLERVPAAYLKKLAGTDGLWEVRVSAGRNAFRLLCFLDGMNVVVVLTGFAKKTEKAPLLEIQVAQQRRRDYLNRKQANGG
jgi:phage-related protein